MGIAGRWTFLSARPDGDAGAVTAVVRGSGGKKVTASTNVTQHRLDTILDGKEKH